ncbi:MAG: AAA family ATPase [Oscillospiraceae bacterium]|nr:AAA family ATPase [Oscillospiraceae bacterium]
MSDLQLSIKKIKNIQSCDLELPLEKGLYAIVGDNGCGKSTLMLAMSLLVKPSSRFSFQPHDFTNDSLIKLTVDGITDHWFVSNGEWSTSVTKSSPKHNTHNYYNGFYEGSIFFGSRFYDYNNVQSFLKKDDFESMIREADSFVTETLSYILHGDKKHYKQLYKVKTKKVAAENGFKGIPYFLKCGDYYTSQYNMSSGESMLISLIDFINNLTERNRYTSEKPLLFLIDEAELALHPAAINRLVTLFNEMLKKLNLVVIFSTHSTEIINRISPKNIYMLENNSGIMSSLNPCYPNYAIRNLYVPNGYDFIILVEDELAKAVIERLIRSNNICTSRLWYVVPSGDWAQTLKLQNDIQKSGLLGIGKRVISILDGDVKEKAEVKAEELHLSLFTCLPIKSVEKYLYKKLISEYDASFIKLLGDKYFTLRSLHDIIADYNENYPNESDNNGKKLYKMICSNLDKVGISSERFIQYLCEDICQYENFSAFIGTLTRLLS